MDSDFEKLGAFYLGREYDLRSGKTTAMPLLYDAKDLTTHAVVVGMTGSGKTGLCISMLEEAALDNIPAIVIDPKGDISNLLLTFPELSATDFQPWVDPSQASRNGQTIEEFAKSTAKLWKDGLESWGQGPDRIRTLRDKVDISIFTPGSNAGIPITVLKSFDAPTANVIDDSDLFRERIHSATSGLLALLGINADPIQSREFILVSKIFDAAWRTGKNLDIASLIGEIQTPPFKKVGIIELEKFYPEKDRMTLAMTLNNLLASPSFEAWLQGEPLNIKNLLHTETGKPRISILSIAHLSDKERMFFVTILLNEMISWMRTQAGTSSLRALLYMDEVFGYFPPQSNPPSKTPMLTLLKQARAYGLGCILATQNPVDLDYKGLSNTGTWFLGRLQTERDKARVLEGLEGASASTGVAFNRGAMEETLAGLGSRVFLMNNVHDDQPVVFHTRWAMSYLRGPLTRTHIEKLMEEKKAALQTAASSTVVPPPVGSKTLPPPTPESVATAEVAAQKSTRTKPPKGIKEYFVEPQKHISSDEKLVYRPMLMGTCRLHYSRATYKIDEWTTKRFVSKINSYNVDDPWMATSELPADLDTIKTADKDAEYGPLPEELEVSKNYSAWEKQLKSYLYREQEIVILKCSDLKEYSKFGEDESDFRARLSHSVNEKRDLSIEKLRKKYASKLNTLQNRIERAEQKVEVETQQYKQSRLSSLLSIGSSIFGALLGNKTLSKTNVSKASTSVKSVGRTAQQHGDIGRAKESVESLQEDYAALEKEFDSAVAEISEKLNVDSLTFEKLTLAPKKTDISIKEFGVAWLPWKVDSTGIAEPLF